MNFEEKTINTKHIFEGKIIKLDQLTVQLPDGKAASREIVLHPGASAVIPISDKGELYMVRQYRKPIETVSLEIPAGKLDPNEAPEVCAERELREETGLKAKNIKHLISVYSTPGFSNEILHLYAATGLEEGDSNADEDEFLSSEKIPVEKLLEMVLRGEIKDAKTVIGILLADKVMKGEIEL